MKQVSDILGGIFLFFYFFYNKNVIYCSTQFQNVC